MNFSVFYVWQFPLLILGIISLLRAKTISKKVLLIWILLAPIPAALTRDPFHTYRSILLYMPLSILIGLGLNFVLKSKKYKKFTFAFLTIFALSIGAYLFSLLRLTSVYYSREWDYGYREIAEVIKSEPNDLRVVIDDPHTDSYIHLLFYGVIPIEEYQSVTGAFIENKYYSSSEKLRPEKVGRVEFRSVDWPSERGDPKTLFIFPADRLYPSEFSGDPKLTLIKTINSL